MKLSKTLLTALILALSQAANAHSLCTFAELSAFQPGKARIALENKTKTKGSYFPDLTVYAEDLPDGQTSVVATRLVNGKIIILGWIVGARPIRISLFIDQNIDQSHRQIDIRCAQ